MDYYFLDAVTWQHSQALYHAAAHLGREALFVLRPATPYVCIGYHQDAQQEIDLEFTAGQNIPVFRREVGGGAVYLDGQQLFFQLILRADRPGVPANKAEFYRKFLQPVIDTYRAFGVPADYKPVNDIVTNGRKISGTGAAQVDDMLILVGNFIQDFNYEMMSKCLRVPDEKFRDKVHKTMYENLTTFLRETGNIPANAELATELARRYAPLLGEMVEKPLDEELIHKADELLSEMNTPEWLQANDRRQPDSTQVKIAEGVYVIQKMLKTPGGLIRMTAVNREGKLKDVHISGDFFFFPATNLVDLEQALDGVPVENDTISQTV
ncbi:MAG TPA: lipoate protein ligase C-terminal domain-containing protein, partial [Anaerolineaceae bacterium]|nr:lipoate protein ligase C-terminal domain-containing protein [Anaerolineaceae bacterium]